MADEVCLTKRFTPDMIEDAIWLWARSSITLLDVRYSLLDPANAIEDYIMPASTMLYVYGGSGDVRLNQTMYPLERYNLFHGGKGTELTIHPTSPRLELYMVFYKAKSPSHNRRELPRLKEQAKPFDQVYGFSPGNPLFFAKKFHDMHISWGTGSALGHLQAKSSFYQLVHELYKELERGDISYIDPDYAEWVRQYLDKHFTEPISIQQLAEMLPISRSLLSKLFRKREQKSLQEYLNEKRLEAAMKGLQDTQATIQEIAVGSGFMDELNLIRMFKKQTRMTPSEFRRKMITESTNNDIDNHYHRLYNGKGLAGLVKSKEDGELSMFGLSGNKTVILAAAMSLMLLLSACGTAAPANNTGSANSNSTQTESNSEATAAEQSPTTRTVQTVKGEIEVPINPQRVVVNWYAGDVYALDLNIVGYSGWAQETMPFYDKLMDSIKIENWEPEDVMALDPDLIVTYDEADFDKFKSIAPVLVVPETDITSLERVKIIGEATGREELANEAVATFEAKLAEAKEKFKGSAFEGKTFSILEDWGPSGDWSGIAYETESRGGTLVYHHLGLQIPQKVQELIDSGQGRGTLSYEVAHEYFGDYILWFRQEGTDSEYQKTEIWKSLPAVTENRLVEIPGNYQGLFYYSDVLSLTAQLDYMVDAINSLAQ
ncbi:helix-turn-helix domain-containing protein [Paenibacillus senegalimassiliensis]|uniref:helix-turn-helix domain-containing protein n=1 Tax=Paenibacillus senegalimassiliensis TaxID=1737426 RepID=UPI0009E74542|nr:AraC family transcriptional regulator [Paenibacillus senegalimassiliensis]